MLDNSKKEIDKSNQPTYNWHIPTKQKTQKGVRNVRERKTDYQDTCR